MTLRSTARRTIAMLGMALSMGTASVARADIQGTVTPVLLGATVSAFPSCLAWAPTGVCFFLYCTPFGCTIKTSIRIRHYVPDAIVSTYADPLNHPWTDVGKPFSAALSAAGSTLLAKKLDSSASTARETKEMASFKNADAIGNPLANLLALASGSGAAAMPSSVGIPDAQELMAFPSEELPRIASLWASVPSTMMSTMAGDWQRLAANPGSLLSGITSLPSQFAGLGGMASGMMGSGGAGGSGGSGDGSGSSWNLDASSLQTMVTSLGGGDGGDLFCPGGTSPFSVYYQGDLDSWFWRSMFPLDLLYPQSWIPTMSEVGSMATGNTWGNLYPRMGELVQSHPAKASAVFSARVHSVISQRAQAHIYKRMQTPGGYVYFQRYAKPIWQPLFPVPEPSCIEFGTNDTIGPFSARDFKTSSTDGYIWNMWTLYECCKSKGAFLFAVP